MKIQRDQFRGQLFDRRKECLKRDIPQEIVHIHTSKLLASNVLYEYTLGYLLNHIN